MAEFLHFSRDSLYMKDGYFWSIPVLDGFNYSQATNATEITLNEMEDASGRSRRGHKMFTDSLSAADFSFSTYIRLLNLQDQRASQMVEQIPMQIITTQ